MSRFGANCTRNYYCYHYAERNVLCANTPKSVIGGNRFNCGGRLFCACAGESVLGQRPRATVSMTASQIKPPAEMTRQWCSPTAYCVWKWNHRSVNWHWPWAYHVRSGEQRQTAGGRGLAGSMCIPLCVYYAHSSINTHMCWLGFSSQTMERKESKNDAKQMRRRRRRL